MTFSDAGKACVFSQISGVITLGGKPVANAKITRTVNLNKDKVDYAYTDENGYFEIPAVFQKTLTTYLPHEFVAKQDIVIQYNGSSYDIWSGVKRTPKENAEARGKALSVQCELSAEKQFKQVNNSPYISRCIWDAEPDDIDTGF